MRVVAAELVPGMRSEFGPVVAVGDGGVNRHGLPVVLVEVRWSSRGEGLLFDLRADQLVTVD